MINKPFRPPSFRRPELHPSIVESLPPAASYEPPAKRRRISPKEEKDGGNVEVIPDSPPALAQQQQVVKKPTWRTALLTLDNIPIPEAAPREFVGKMEKLGGDCGHSAYYAVLWRKPTAKKHKTWDGDGTLHVRNGLATLRDNANGKEMGRTSLDKPLLVGSTLKMAGKEIEVDDVLKEKPSFAKDDKDNDVAITHVRQAKSQMPTPKTTVPSKKTGNSFQMAVQQHKEDPKKAINRPAPRIGPSTAAFKNPLKDMSQMPQVQKGPDPTPRHDPAAPGALVMKRPSRVPDGKRIVDVVLDPVLTKHLRDHQREGVKFLYECVMGLRDFNGEGAILADEMGLGKTLQTIALIWTLMKQNPIHEAPPVIKKALIVCPVTLINNWRKEFRKWLGNERIGVFVADGKKTRLTDFTMGKSYSVMIIGYERLRQVAEDLTKGAGIDLVVADEGHRLKTEKNKSAQAIQSLNTAKRIILSGTPIQNDLSEFFSMVNFVNDGILGNYKRFVKQFETPMVRSRQPDASEEEMEQGQECGEELARLTSPFILRRTADLLSKYLPPKTEYVLFCDPLPAQALAYRQVLSSPLFQSVGNSENALQLITILKKLCNSPVLLNPRLGAESDSGNSSKLMGELIESLPPQLHKSLSNQASIKLRILDQLLDTIHKKTTEKVVLVSNYTSTLDIIAGLLGSAGLSYLRLDGSTPATKRQGLVDDFNRSPRSSAFAFLLSAKAGGVGINLIGASRLVLFDVDWNPAIDMQAMARIHREGQKKPCHIYRFVVKGSAEERIWQRQVTKLGLADSVMDMGGSGKGGGSAAGQFSKEELKDLFRLDDNEALRTHEVLGCSCGGHGTMKVDTAAVGEGDYIDIDALDNASGTATPILEVNDESISIVSDDEEEEEDDIQPARRITKASKIPPVDESEPPQEANANPSSRKAKEKAIQKAGLMTYQHIDVLKLSFDNKHSTAGVEDNDVDSSEDMTSTTTTTAAEDLVGDEILFDVLRNGAGGGGGKGRVKWVFRKTSENAKVREKKRKKEYDL